MTQSLDELMRAQIEECAMNLADHWRLYDDQGRIWCAREGCQRLALLPSLHCGPCLGEHYRRNGITHPWCPNHEQQEAAG